MIDEPARPLNRVGEAVVRTGGVPQAPLHGIHCYIKRYRFLEGLAVYWPERTILENTRTRKLAKLYTPFSYKHEVTDALRSSFTDIHSARMRPHGGVTRRSICSSAGNAGAGCGSSRRSPAGPRCGVRPVTAWPLRGRAVIPLGSQYGHVS